jgi:NADPH:quinone reductase-like Zn-dependent oxidoreductase
LQNDKYPAAPERRSILSCITRMERKSMKAAVYTRYGPPDVLSIREVAKPVPKDNDVLIEVRATTVNRTDCGFLRGTPRLARLVYGVRGPKHPTLGNEFAGRVAAVGRAVTSYAVGDDVFGYNDSTFGGHARYMTMPEVGMMARMPSNLTHEEAAPTAEGAHYALGNLRKAGVGPGQRVLVYGATGAIGSAAVQLAKHLGAEVTAVCATPQLELVRSLGADRVVDYTTEDFTRSGGEYDLVFDAVGKSSFGACRKLLGPGGIYSSTELGFLWQNPLLALWTSRFGKHRVTFPIPRTSREDMEFLRGLVETGAFRPVIDRRYRLDQIVEAFRYVKTGQEIGNIMLTVGHGERT